ncbi:MAG: metal-sulfur cluster assembly factor [Actinomycetaceae bacterium]|nr:metal-sulfur cluster assembly factor [Actinomycetaceae bacterium]
MNVNDEREEAPAYPAQGENEESYSLSESELAELTAISQPTRLDILEALRCVIDPELGINIVDLGLVYEIRLDGTKVVIDMTLTSAACPLTDVLEDQVADVLSDLVTSSRINWVWLPPWGPERITDQGREMLQALGFNV